MGTTQLKPQASETCNGTNNNLPVKLNDRYVKATLYCLDGEIKEIVQLIPRFDGWMDPIEIAANLMIEYVNRLTRYWVKISHFSIEFGSIDKKKGFITTVKYRDFIIPTEQIFVSGNYGEWVAPTREYVWKHLDGTMS